ncbi:MAG: lytic transglycosylase domain-containing protein [Rhodobacteraceae bacterium]|nr:lytic transglycosylase domain-containing protein [Paracoccaceae bacterium]
MFAVLQAAQDAGLTLFVGPLGLRWEPSDRLPLRAATQPRVTINEAVRRLRAKAQGPVGDSAGFRRVDAPRSVKPIFNTAQARRYTPLIAQVALSEGVEPALVHAIVAVESAYNPQARSSAGAVGLMQLMPATAERFGLSRTERTHPAKNLRAGIRYLKFLNRTFDGNLALMLAGYNAGENAVLKYHRQIPPYRETQNYVRKVQRFYARYTPTKGAS